jgi:hypothetical protein
MGDTSPFIASNVKYAALRRAGHVAGMETLAIHGSGAKTSWKMATWKKTNSHGRVFGKSFEFESLYDYQIFRLGVP